MNEVDDLQIFDLIDSIEGSLAASNEIARQSSAAPQLRAVRRPSVGVSNYDEIESQRLPTFSEAPVDDGEWGRTSGEVTRLSCELRAHPDAAPTFQPSIAKRRGTTADILATFKWG